MKKGMEEFACYNVEKCLLFFFNLTTFSVFPAFWNVLVKSHFCRHLNDTVLWIDQLLNSVVLLCLQVTGCLPWQRGTLLVATWNRHLRGRWQWERRGACSELSWESCYWNVALQPSHLRRWGCAPTCFLQRTKRKWTTGCSKKSETKPIARVFIWQDIINSE